VPAIAIPAAISAGSSILGGVLGSRASKKAAQTQSDQANRSATELKDVLNQYNPAIGAAADTAAGNVNTATAAGQADIRGAVGAGQGRIDTATGKAIGYLQPYMDAGGESLTTLRGLMGPGGDLNKQFTTADMQAYDPGYSFRMEQAAKALQGSAAARGGALGGGVSRALVGLSQNLASSEFGAAEQRFRAQQGDRFNRLNTLVNLGATTADRAAGYGTAGASEAARLGLTGATSAADLGLRGASTAGGFTTDAANRMTDNALRTYGNIEDLMTGGAAAKAAGTVGSANAWTGALGGVANAAGQVGNYYQNKQTLATLMQNPAAQGWNYGAGNQYGSTPYGGGAYDPVTGAYTVRRRAGA
jgi:hypothetical protein